MFLIFGKSEAQRSYKHGSYKKKCMGDLSPILSYLPLASEAIFPNQSFRSLGADDSDSAEAHPDAVDSDAVAGADADAARSDSW